MLHQNTRKQLVQLLVRVHRSLICNYMFANICNVYALDHAQVSYVHIKQNFKMAGGRLVANTPPFSSFGVENAKKQRLK